MATPPPPVWTGKQPTSESKPPPPPKQSVDPNIGQPVITGGSSGGSRSKKKPVPVYTGKQPVSESKPVQQSVDPTIARGAGIQSESEAKAQARQAGRDLLSAKQQARIIGFGGTPQQQQTIRVTPPKFKAPLTQEQISRLSEIKPAPSPPKSFYERTIQSFIKRTETAEQKARRERISGRRSPLLSPRTTEDISAALSAIATKEQVASLGKRFASATATAAGATTLSILTGGLSTPVLAATTLPFAAAETKQTQKELAGIKGIQKKERVAKLGAETTATIGGAIAGVGIGRGIPKGITKVRTKLGEFRSQKMISARGKEPLRLIQGEKGQTRLKDISGRRPKLPELKRTEQPIVVKTPSGKPLVTTPSAYQTGKKTIYVFGKKERLTVRPSPSAPPKDIQTKLSYLRPARRPAPPEPIKPQNLFAGKRGQVLIQKPKVPQFNRQFLRPTRPETTKVSPLPGEVTSQPAGFAYIPPTTKISTSSTLEPKPVPSQLPSSLTTADIDQRIKPLPIQDQPTKQFPVPAQKQPQKQEPSPIQIIGGRTRQASRQITRPISQPKIPPPTKPVSRFPPRPPPTQPSKPVEPPSIFKLPRLPERPKGLQRIKQPTFIDRKESFGYTPSLFGLTLPKIPGTKELGTKQFGLVPRPQIKEPIKTKKKRKKKKGIKINRK